MCGIVGLIGRAPAAEAERRVAAAVRELRHRGPDGEGLLVQATGCGSATLIWPHGRELVPALRDGSQDACGIAVGHRRLAIIDPTDAAAQPMLSAGGRYVLLFNGEIYNYLELRAELQASGTQFRSASDTEVLLAGYERWGLQVLDRVVGMFAVAIFDRVEQEVLLARDCFGMKPLYYARNASEFGFASEPGVLLSLLHMRAEVDGQGLADYLVHGLTDHRVGTMFAGIRAVPAASHLRVSLCDGRVAEPVRYWSPSTDRLDDRPPARIARELRHHFLESVRLHLRSDVRVGALLSGGLDSSAIVASMREVGGARLEIRTFSFIPDADAVSEERWIDEVNASTRAIPHKIRISRDVWEAEARPLAERQGEPFGSLAIHAQSTLFRTAAEHGVRVLLDGQGADEMLAGYARFRGARMAGHLRRSEYRRARGFATGLRGDGAGWRRAMAPYVDGARLLLPPVASRIARRIGVQSSIACQAWLRARGLRAREMWRPSGNRVLHERLCDAIETTSLPALLRYADRSAMMHGVESRLPFLTRDLVQFALALPDHLLVSDDGIGKTIFREAMRGLVPASVLDRREKVGFAVPLREWLVGSRYVNSLTASIAALPCVDTRRTGRWIADVSAGRPLAASKVFLMWRLLGLAEWMRCYDVALD